MTPYIKGYRGSWFADVDGERLPCVHEYWKKSGSYEDPGCMPETDKWPRFIGAISSGKRVLLTRSKVTDAPERKSGKSLARRTYLSIWSVDNVVADDRSIRFDFVSKLASLD